MDTRRLVYLTLKTTRTCDGQEITCGTAVYACGASFAADAGIEEFNRALIEATTRMDNAAALTLWEENGIALLPQTQAHDRQKGDRNISR